MSDQTEPQKVNIAESGRSRLYLGQTAINFFGRRLIGVVVSSLLLVVTIISLAVQGLNLGIDFEGGTSWDVPASSFTVADADEVLLLEIDPALVDVPLRADAIPTGELFPHLYGPLPLHAVREVSKR